MYTKQTKYKQAIEIQHQRLKIAQDKKDAFGEMCALSNIAMIYIFNQEYVEAIGELKKGLTIAQKIGTSKGKSMILLNLGIVYMQFKQYSEAIKYITESLNIFQEKQDFLGQWHALANLGDIHDDMNSYTKAFNYYLQALTITRNTQDIKGEEEILSRLSSNIYLTNFVLHMAHKEDKTENEILLEICKICCAIGDYDTATKINNLNLLNLQTNSDKSPLNLGDNKLSIE